MKSISSFTVLPDGALYCLSNMSFMMRVGGQSGTAMRQHHVLGDCRSEACAATVITAASGRGRPQRPFSLVVPGHPRFPPYC